MPSNLVQVTARIKGLARSGRVGLARILFDEMPHRDAIAWNAMLSSYSQLGLHREALSLFHHMRISGSRPDHFTYTSALSACSGSMCINYGIQIHAQVVISGWNYFLPVNNALLNMYGKCSRPCSAGKLFEEMGSSRNDLSWCSLLFAYTNVGWFGDARLVFDKMPNRVIVAWNTMIVGYSRFGEIWGCFEFFKEMIRSDYGPDHCTFSAIMNACAEIKDCRFGLMIHSLIVKSGWSIGVEVSNSILSLYAKLGCQDDFTKIYESVEILTQVSFNAIIDAHMKFGDTQKALLVFQQAPEKNIVSWTSMITGYAKNGDEELSLTFFTNMIKECLKPDNFTFGAVLHACSNLATLNHGRMVHGSIIRYGFHTYAYVGNGLINMYGKCGDIEGANKAFIDIFHKDLVSCNALLFAYGLHGQGSRSLSLFSEMKYLGIKPDKVTFIGLLVTCSHSGLIEQGQVLFESMSSVHGISPEMDHVICLVDMLSRSGYLEEARELSRKYAKTDDETNSAFDEAIFGACSCHSDLKLGAKLGGDLKILEPRNEMNYVLLSNLYSASGKWKEAEAIRESMTNRSVKKMPGCSWVEVENQVVAFLAGRSFNPYFEEITEILYFLEQGMRNPCFTAVEIQ